MPTIAHISSVHNANDPRIRRKQLGAVISNGWTAKFITGDLNAISDDGVEIIPVWPGRSHRLVRLLVTSPLAVIAAFRTNADVYHLHDPELLLWAWILRLRRKPVVYDIHEDYRSSMLQKHYIPRIFRTVLAAFSAAFEKLFSRSYVHIIAEKYYVRRFPNSIPILNYPPVALADTGIAHGPGGNSVLYTGNITRDRGALQMAKLARGNSTFEVTAIGHCSPTIAAEMRSMAGEYEYRLHIIGVGHYVPFDDIVDAYAKKKWLAGLALFPDTLHYREKELTKFFEYMAVGLPIVASNFPVWRTLIEGEGVGICVNADEPQEVVNALNWLSMNPDNALAMANRGRELVRVRYNWEQEGRRLVEMYSTLLTA